MSKKREILEAIEKGHLVTALRLIADGINEGDNTVVAANIATAQAAADAAQADATTALSQNTTEEAKLADHESRISALE